MKVTEGDSVVTREANKECLGKSEVTKPDAAERSKKMRRNAAGSQYAILVGFKRVLPERGRGGKIHGVGVSKDRK